MSKFSLSKKSEEEEMFVKEVIAIFKSLDTLTLLNQESLEQVVNSLALKINQAWNANARKVNITKHKNVENSGDWYRERQDGRSRKKKRKGKKLEKRGRKKKRRRQKRRKQWK